MNFYQQYRDLFQVGNVPIVPSQRLRLDNQLFIDRPFIPTYTQEYSLNSKLRELKKDYNQFQSRVQQLEELQDIPQRSQLRRKQYVSENQNNLKNNNRSPAINNDNLSRNQYSHKKHQSTIFDHYQQNKSQFVSQKQLQQRGERSLPNQSPLTGSNQPSLTKQKYHQPSQSPFGNSSDNRNPYQLNQKQNQNSFRNNSISQNQQSLSPQKQLLESIRKQNEQNTTRIIKNQNIMKNKFYQQDTNNVLKQSQINHIFNWKLQKPSTFDKLDYLPQSTIPKYKVQTSTLQPRQRQQNNNRSFAIRNVPSNTQLKPNNRNKIVPQQKQYNVPNKNSSAQERRRIAKQNIDARREKLKLIIKAYF